MMIKKKNKIFSLSIALVFASSLFMPRAVMAQEHDTAKVYVQVAQAIPGGDAIDPRLGSIQADLNNTFRKASYAELDEMRFDLALQEQQTRPLPGGSQMTVQYMGSDAGRFTLNVIMNDPNGNQILNTNFTIAKGGTIIVGGPAYKEGNLVLAIKASSK